MVKWIWDIDERICINVAAIKYFEIVKQYEGDEEDRLWACIGKGIDSKIFIAQSPDIGILKDKIRTIIAGD